MSATATIVVGLTLEELAARLGRSLQTVAALLKPVVAAGFVEEQDGLLVVMDVEIRAGFANREPAK
jgi:hypothetical protein